MVDLSTQMSGVGVQYLSIRPYKGKLCLQNRWLDANVHGHGDASWYVNRHFGIWVMNRMVLAKSGYHDAMLYRDSSRFMATYIATHC